MSPVTSCDLLVLGGTLLRMDEDMTAIGDGALAVRGGRILAAGPRDDIESSYRAPATVYAAGKIVMPGLVNSHTHTPMAVLRGYGDDLALKEWLEDYVWPWEHAFINPETVRVSSRLAIAEMLLGGTTTFSDMYFYGAATAEVASSAGMRAVVGEGYAEGGPYGFEHMRSGTSELIRSFSNSELITPSVIAHSVYAVTEEHLLGCLELAGTCDLMLQIHIAETAGEVGDVLSRTGMRPVAYADSLGLLGPRTLAVHCVHCTGEEIALLSERGVGVSHTPQSEMKLSSGVAPVPAMLSAGITVGLGTDGVASNNVLDMFAEAKAAALLHKVTTGDPTALDARTVARMATVDGARAIGLGDETGSLEPGKRADVILIDMDRPHAVPCHDPYSHFAYAMKASDISTVIVEGSIVVDERELVTIDLERATREVVELARRTGTTSRRD
jgi:5-methylthioadenosine/S-adenosylhomocysteine deaminase